MYELKPYKPEALGTDEYRNLMTQLDLGTAPLKTEKEPIHGRVEPADGLELEFVEQAFEELVMEDAIGLELIDIEEFQVDRH